MFAGELVTKLNTFVLECKRVLAVTRKPSRSEFTTIVKVTGVGIFAIGLIGFLLQLARNLFL